MKHDPTEFDRALQAAGVGRARLRGIDEKVDLKWRVAHDSLTGLANRRQFEIELAHRLDDPGARVALLMIDIDRFKPVNDGHGHQVGDQMLHLLALRMANGIRRGDLAARLGGDEFAIILDGLQSPDSVRAKADDLVNRLCHPMMLGGHRIPCSVSVGLAIADGQSRSSETLVRNADAALYFAKAGGGGRLKLFDEHLRADLMGKTAAESRARRAIHARSIFPMYQPKVDLVTGDVIGFEALMSWKDDAGNLETPACCPQILEDPLLAHLAIDTMLGLVLGHLHVWQAAGVARPIALNLTDADLRRTEFAQWFLTRIAKAGLPAGLVQVEISERAPLSRHPGQIADTLMQLSSDGVRISLDDFGTGSASLVHLRTFPIDQIKIDGSFVGGIVTEPDDRAIVSSIVALSARLSIEVVADGVETADQSRILRKEGCRIGQGALLGQPGTATSVPRLVRNGVEGRKLG